MAHHEKDRQQLTDRAERVAARLIPALQDVAGRIGASGAEGALARGILFQNAAYLEDAIESFRDALSCNPEANEAAARLVLTLLRARRPEAALEAAMALAKRAPDYAMPELTTDQSVGAFTLLGNALVANGRLAEATRAYEGALKRRPEDATAAARLAQVYIATGETDKAVGQAKAVRANARFEGLASLLELGRDNSALLSAFSPAGRIGQIALDDHGRPYTVEGAIHLAEIVETGEWNDEPIEGLPEAC